MTIWTMQRMSQQEAASLKNGTGLLQSMTKQEDHGYDFHHHNEDEDEDNAPQVRRLPITSIPQTSDDENEQPQSPAMIPFQSPPHHEQEQLQQQQVLLTTSVSSNRGSDDRRPTYRRQNSFQTVLDDGNQNDTIMKQPIRKINDSPSIRFPSNNGTGGDHQDKGSLLLLTSLSSYEGTCSKRPTSVRQNSFTSLMDDGNQNDKPMTPPTRIFTDASARCADSEYAPEALTDQRGTRAVYSRESSYIDSLLVDDGTNDITIQQPKRVSTETSMAWKTKSEQVGNKSSANTSNAESFLMEDRESPIKDRSFSSSRRPGYYRQNSFDKIVGDGQNDSLMRRPARRLAVDSPGYTVASIEEKKKIVDATFTRENLEGSFSSLDNLGEEGKNDTMLQRPTRGPSMIVASSVSSLDMDEDNFVDVESVDVDKDTHKIRAVSGICNDGLAMKDAKPIPIMQSAYSSSSSSSSSRPKLGRQNSSDSLVDDGNNDTSLPSPKRSGRKGTEKGNPTSGADHLDGGDHLIDNITQKEVEHVHVHDFVPSTSLPKEPQRPTWNGHNSFDTISDDGSNDLLLLPPTRQETIEFPSFIMEDNGKNPCGEPQRPTWNGHNSFDTISDDGSNDLLLLPPTRQETIEFSSPIKEGNGNKPTHSDNKHDKTPRSPIRSTSKVLDTMSTEPSAGHEKPFNRHVIDDKKQHRAPRSLIWVASVETESDRKRDSAPLTPPRRRSTIFLDTMPTLLSSPNSYARLDEYSWQEHTATIDHGYEVHEPSTQSSAGMIVHSSPSSARNPHSAPIGMQEIARPSTRHSSSTGVMQNEAATTGCQRRRSSIGATPETPYNELVFRHNNASSMHPRRSSLGGTTESYGGLPKPARRRSSICVEFGRDVISSAPINNTVGKRKPRRSSIGAIYQNPTHYTQLSRTSMASHGDERGQSLNIEAVDYQTNSNADANDLPPLRNLNGPSGEEWKDTPSDSDDKTDDTIGFESSNEIGHVFENMQAEKEEIKTENTLGPSKALVKLAGRFFNGVTVSTHSYHFKKYEETFIGCEAVDFMVESGMALTREDAVFVGQRFMKEINLFHHTYWDHTFKDDFKFYRYNEDVTSKFLGTGSFRLAEMSNELFVTADLQVQEDSSTTGESNSQGSLISYQGLKKIAETFKNNLRASTHTYHFKRYKKTFVGKEAVDFMVESKMVSSRKAAVFLGQRLLDELNFFHHVSHDHQFKDAHLLYRYSEDYVDSSDSNTLSDFGEISERSSWSISPLSNSNRSFIADLEGSFRNKFFGSLRGSSKRTSSDPSSISLEESIRSVQRGEKKSALGQQRSAPKPSSNLRRCVTWDSIQIRHYERILEVHPSTSSGPSVGLGWKYEETPPKPFKNNKNSQTKKAREFVLSSQIRKDMMMEWGFSKRQITQASKLNEKIRSRRKQTLNKLTAKTME